MIVRRRFRPQPSALSVTITTRHHRRLPTSSPLSTTTGSLALHPRKRGKRGLPIQPSSAGFRLLSLPQFNDHQFIGLLPLSVFCFFRHALAPHRTPVISLCPCPCPRCRFITVAFPFQTPPRANNGKKTEPRPQESCNKKRKGKKKEFASCERLVKAFLTPSFPFFFFLYHHHPCLV